MTDALHRPTERVLDILQILSQSADGMTLTQIAASISAPKSSIVPVIRTMTEKKFISRNRETGGFSVGISSFLAGNAYNRGDTVLQFIRDEMREIVSGINEICHLGVLDNNEVLYIAKVDSRDPIQVISYVGKRLPVHCTALGKALICTWRQQEIREAFPHGLSPVTSKTVCSAAALEKQLETVRRQGIATDDEEVSEHLHCLAVPLENRGNIVAALSVSLPSFRLTPEKGRLIRKTLAASKQKIETYLETAGFTGKSLIDGPS